MLPLPPSDTLTTVPRRPLIRLPSLSRETLGGDVLAGVSVALVLIPQAMAYADLAGLPPVHGLYAGAVAPILAAPFASSRFLQTGPTALTCLLTLGGLGTLFAPYSSSYVAAAALLALLVGVVRIAIGLLRGGAIARVLSEPVLRGFTLGAAVLIGGSQISAAFGAPTPEGGVVLRAARTLADPASWTPGAVVLTVVTIALMRGGKRIHPLFPGVLVAAVLGLGASVLGLGVGPSIGAIPGSLPRFDVAFPWAATPQLLIPALVIAVVGFAEPAAIARAYDDGDGEPWDADREFVSQGVANVTAGVFSGFPVGGSFSRSALTHVAGGRTVLAGAMTGLIVLAVVPFASLLAPLPRAILGATVLGAVVKLLDPRPVLHLWTARRRDGLLALTTLLATLLSAPHVEYGVLVGVGLSLLVYRGLPPESGGGEE